MKYMGQELSVRDVAAFVGIGAVAGLLARKYGRAGPCRLIVG